MPVGGASSCRSAILQGRPPTRGPFASTAADAQHKQNAGAVSMPSGSEFRQAHRIRSRVTVTGTAHRNHVLSELSQPFDRGRRQQRRFAAEPCRDRAMLMTLAFALLTV